MLLLGKNSFFFVETILAEAEDHSCLKDFNVITGRDFYCSLFVEKFVKFFGGKTNMSCFSEETNWHFGQ